MEEMKKNHNKYPLGEWIKEHTNRKGRNIGKVIPQLSEWISQNITENDNEETKKEMIINYIKENLND